MSNKPKVYGTCAAGCRWEVPHMSDLAKTAAYIRQVPENLDPDYGARYLLDAGETYLVSLPAPDSVGFANLAYMHVAWHVGYPNSDAGTFHKYAQPIFVGNGELAGYFPTKTTVCVIGVRLKDDVFELVYQNDDQLYVISLIDLETLGINLHGHEKFVIDSIELFGATECLHYNNAVKTIIDPEKVGDGLTVDEDGVLKADALIPAAGVTKITKDKIFYQMYNDIELAIDCDFESLPVGYFGFISITGAGGTITSDKLYPISKNGKTLAEVDYNSGALIMVNKNNTGKKLSWFYFC